MTKKFIDIMDTSFRDGFQSIFGARVLMDDFFPAVEAAKKAGIKHFEFGGGARFQALYFYLNEDAFVMMDKFRKIVGSDVNLQTLARGINTVTLDTGSRDLVDLHAKLFKKHGVTTIRNFDALNDINNLKYPAKRIVHHGLKHEVVITIMDLPPGCYGVHDTVFYEKILRQILDSGIHYDSICFKDSSGTSNPKKIYDTIKMARRLLSKNTHIRLHTHESAGISVSAYLAALEAGIDGIDLAASPVSGGTSQPDILTMLHATKGMKFNLGNLKADKILIYEKELSYALKDYIIPTEAIAVSPLVQFSPMPGGALTANTQMMRDNGILDRYPEIIEAMREVVEKGGYGTSVTPVSQFYFQQALENVLQGSWKVIAPGYGKMVLGYFGKTPAKADSKIIKLAQKQLNLKPTTQKALDIADKDEKKSLKFWRKRLQSENIKITDENIFIAASCKERGIEFLKGNAKLQIRKKNLVSQKKLIEKGKYTVTIDNKTYNIQVEDGNIKAQKVVQDEKKIEPDINEKNIIRALVPGNVYKILVKVGEHVKKDDVIAILESMKMEIDILSIRDGIIESIDINTNDKVYENQIVATIKG